MEEVEKIGRKEGRKDVSLIWIADTQISKTRVW
jgi:hypothetical protein